MEEAPILILKDEHHIWCNWWGRPRAGCKLCERLFKEYPVYPGDKPGDLMKRHFPQNVRRT